MVYFGRFRQTQCGNRRGRERKSIFGTSNSQMSRIDNA